MCILCYSNRKIRIFYCYLFFRNDILSLIVVIFYIEVLIYCSKKRFVFEVVLKSREEIKWLCVYMVDVN